MNVLAIDQGTSATKALLGAGYVTDAATASRTMLLDLDSALRVLICRSADATALAWR